MTEVPLYQVPGHAQRMSDAPAAVSLNPPHHTLHPPNSTLHPPPFTLHPTPSTLHPAPCTIHTTPYTLHTTPYLDHCRANSAHTRQSRPWLSCKSHQRLLSCSSFARKRECGSYLLVTLRCETTNIGSKKRPPLAFWGFQILTNPRKVVGIGTLVRAWRCATSIRCGFRGKPYRGASPMRKRPHPRGPPYGPSHGPSEGS